MNSRADATSRGSILKLTIILAVLGPLLFSGRAASAQDKPSARKFDEFGDVMYSDLIARLDNLAVMLQNEPGTRGFIIVYRSRRDLPGLSNRLALRAKGYMTETRGLPKERVVTVDGGQAMCLTYELWVVDPGAAPTPRSDAYPRNFGAGYTLKFDELYYPLRSDPQGDDYAPVNGISLDVLEAFAYVLRQQPRASAYVIAYKQHHRGLRADAQGVSRKMLTEVRGHLIKEFGVAPARIKVVDGGYRVQRQVELWVVPPGARPPVATPNTYPPKR